MSEDKTETGESGGYVVIDVGCHECGVSSEPVGIYLTEAEATSAAQQRDLITKGWREGGQTYCIVFPMTLPSGDDLQDRS